MKSLLKLLFVPIALLVTTSLVAQSGLTKADRSAAVASLKATQKTLVKAVKGLSDAQLNFKASDEAWSVAECIEHLAVSEKALMGAVEMAKQTPADPSGRSSLAMSDQEVVGMISDRSMKIKTRPDLEPKNSFGSSAGSLDAFKTQRKANMKYVKKTDDDLRHHYFDFPFGKVDAMQVILFMSGHTTRHTDQIKEVMANASFPSA
ncbi:MAG: DinB family protein [Saprospiraceae bacterium]|nr:DinB family protein [Saprospiraceae bacterium]